MKSVGLVASNLWLALSSSRNIASTCSTLMTIKTATTTTTTSTTTIMATNALTPNEGDEPICSNKNAGAEALAAEAVATKDNAAALSKLAEYHPIVVEGMGYYDPRDPKRVASNIVAGIQDSLRDQKKPLLVVTQGDPLAPKGISAITPLVAEALSNKQRGLVCLDESIASYHSPNADRTNVVVEVRYSQLVEILQGKSSQTTDGTETDDENENSILAELDAAVDEHIRKLNRGREKAGKPPVKDYFKTFAMLQEVTKAGLKELCGGNITIAHTSSEINPFSVTSFYKVGLDLGLYEANEIVGYNISSSTSDHSRSQHQQQQQNQQEEEEEEDLDFGTIDPR